MGNVRTSSTARIVATALAAACALPVIGIAQPAAPASAGAPIAGSGSEVFLDADLDGRADVHTTVGQGHEQLVFGDWNGDGVDSPALRVGQEIRIYENDRVVSTFGFGRAGDILVAGDWDGDGDDSIGVRRGHEVMLRNSLDAGSADIVFGYGTASDAMLFGDWDGDGADEVAIRRGTMVYARYSLTAGAADVVFGYGRAGDQVLAGDWDGDGDDDIAVVQNGVVHMRMSLTSGPSERQVTFGRTTDVYFSGSFSRSGGDGIGLRRAPDIRGALAELVSLVNRERANAGLPALSAHASLTEMAGRWSATMASRQSMTHSTTFCDQTFAMGFRRCAENIARTGSTSASSVMSAWMASAGHRANILSPNVTHIGVGVAQGQDGRWYWTQNFGG